MTPEERAQSTYERIKHEMTIAKGSLGALPDDVRWDIITHYLASAIRQAENDAHEMDAEWCELGAQKAWRMMQDEGVSANKQVIVRVCQIFAETIRSFKHKDI